MKILKFTLLAIFLPVYLIAADTISSSDIIGHWIGRPKENTTLNLRFEGNMKLTWIVNENDENLMIEAEYVIKKRDDIYLIKIHKFKNKPQKYQIFKGIIKFLDKDNIKLYGENFKSEAESKYPDEFGENSIVLDRKNTQNKSYK